MLKVIGSFSFHLPAQVKTKCDNCKDCGLTALLSPFAGPTETKVVQRKSDVKLNAGVAIPTMYSAPEDSIGS